MDHQQFKEWLQLSLYEELTKDEKLLLEKHLPSCGECRRELEELRKLHATLAQYTPLASVEELLREARAELRVAIRLEQSKRTFWQRIQDVVDEMILPQYKMALGGVATLAVGVIVGYVAFRTPGREASGLFRQTSQAESSFDQGSAQITNVRFLTRDAASGEIEFTFEAITPVHIKGNVRDEQVRTVLARALVSEQNPGIRLRAVNAMAEIVEPKQYANNEVKAALISALKYDANRGVKQEALRVLQKFLPDPEVTGAILYVLKNEKNTGMKIAAINSLDMSKFDGTTNEELLSVLKQKSQSDENNYIRIRAKAALQEAKAQ